MVRAVVKCGFLDFAAKAPFGKLRVGNDISKRVVAMRAVEKCRSFDSALGAAPLRMTNLGCHGKGGSSLARMPTHAHEWGIRHESHR